MTVLFIIIYHCRSPSPHNNNLAVTAMQKTNAWKGGIKVRKQALEEDPHVWMWGGVFIVNE